MNGEQGYYDLTLAVKADRTGVVSNVTKRLSANELCNPAAIYVPIINQLTNNRDFSNDDIGDIAKVLMRAVKFISDDPTTKQAWTIADHKVTIQFYITPTNLPNPELEKILSDLDNLTQL